MTNLQAKKTKRGSKHASKHAIDNGVLICLSCIILLGLIILYSASYPLAVDRYNDGTMFLRRQLAFLFVGVLGLMAATRIPYRFWAHFSWPLMGVTTFLLALVYIPGIGKTAGGAQRWIAMGPLHFQPSELAKLALIIFLATSIAQKKDKMKRFSVGVLPHFLLSSFLLLPILFQPDFGSFITLVAYILIMLFIGGARIRHLGGICLAALPVMYFLVAGAEYRRKRFLAFLDPWANVRDSGFQIIQSQVAFHRGGLTGVGLGEGQQKLFYLPDIHTDFIFSVVGEEMGFAGVALIVVLFLVFTLMGLLIAVKAHRAGALFGCYLATGLTLLVAVPAFMNMSIVLGLLPTKGMVLPFLSYGGSALIMGLFAAGILLNLSRCVWHEEVA